MMANKLPAHETRIRGFNRTMFLIMRASPYLKEFRKFERYGTSTVTHDGLSYTFSIFKQEGDKSERLIMRWLPLGNIEFQWI